MWGLTGRYPLPRWRIPVHGTGGRGYRAPVTTDAQESVDVIAERAKADALVVACAESLTAGAIASELARGDDASSWFGGGVVAYMSEVKYGVLGVAEGPVVTAACAEQMVDGVCRLTSADAAVAVTGVGGPDPEEGEPSGTVYIATRFQGRTEVTHHRFEGDPPEVLRRTTDTALGRLAARLRSDEGGS